MDSRLGLRLHPAGEDRRWQVELTARIVATQDRVATSLGETQTPDFTVWDIRTFWNVTDDLLLTAGVENFTDKFYREHLDYRSGLGVFRPGVNFYFGTELTY